MEKPLFKDYATEYLQSKLWRKIKRRVLKRDNSLCKLCGLFGNVVHHRSYELNVLNGEDDSKLITLCDSCHTYVHFNYNGGKRTSTESDQIITLKKYDKEFELAPINLRKIIYPENWDFMNGYQKHFYLEEYHSALIQKRIENKRKCLLKKVPERYIIVDVNKYVLAKYFLDDNQRYGLLGLRTILKKSEDGFSAIVNNNSIEAILVNRNYYFHKAQAENAIKELVEEFNRKSLLSTSAFEDKYPKILTDYGYVMFSENFKFIFSNYKSYRKRDDGHWCCLKCSTSNFIVKEKEITKCTNCGKEEKL